MTRNQYNKVKTKTKKSNFGIEKPLTEKQLKELSKMYQSCIDSGADMSKIDRMLIAYKFCSI